MAFGPDGFLYLSTGDAEVPAPPDPRITGQDLDDFLSCILRIDVDRRDAGKAYAVPKDNPFVAKLGAMPEIWAHGFRNPWKISFDRKTGNLWCGDVGWEQWENIFLVTRGGNYGWSCMEGNYSLFPERKGPTPISPPVVTHSHTEAASITGGFVYHGRRLPELEGAYVYADYETGKIWALWHDGRQITRHDEIADTNLRIVTFGQGEDGELLFAHYGTPSTLHRLARNPAAGRASAFPRRLSETGLFTDVAKQTPSPGVQPFDVRAPMWADGAIARRFIGMVAGEGVTTSIRENKNRQRIESRVTWPKDAVLVKTLSLEIEAGSPATARNIETQMLHFDGDGWNAYTYRWNDAGTDAELVAAHGEERVIERRGNAFPGGRRHHTWRYQSRAECLRCHNNWNQFTLGFQPQQLTDASASQAVAAGRADADYLRKSDARLVNPHDAASPLEARARSWLHANCCGCHREHGGGSVPLMLNIEMPAGQMRALGEKPLRGDFGIPGASIITPGDPWTSVLLHRIATTSSGHMPAIGPPEVDAAGLDVLIHWVQGLATPGALMDPKTPRDLSRPTEALYWAWLCDQQPQDRNVLSLARKTALESPSAHIRGLLERFLPDEQRVPVLGSGASPEKILAKQGDAARGAALLSISGKGAVCLACHFIKGSGRDFGPDLSKAGARLAKAQIIECLLLPSKTITEGYKAATITVQDGTVQSGFIVKRDAASLTLKLASGQSLALPASSVKAEQALPMSLMPEGLLQSFTAQEAADLVEYLAGLR
jgi:putative heme-binding domain-containing protein